MDVSVASRLCFKSRQMYTNYKTYTMISSKINSIHSVQVNAEPGHWLHCCIANDDAARSAQLSPASPKLALNCAPESGRH